MCTTRHTCTLTTLTLFALVLAGCPSEDTATDDAGISDAADTATPEDTGRADAGTDAEEDTGMTDTGMTDTGRPPPVVQFQYLEETPECSRNCEQGVKVNLLANPPKITEIEDRNEDEELKDADVQDLRDTLLTEETADKLKNGWECGEETKHNGQFHSFEGYLRESDLTDQPRRQNVAGCVADDSTQPAADDVQSIIDKLNGLRSDYF